jgi:hypothetical protein
LHPRDESPIEIANRIVPLRLVLEWTNIRISEFTHGKSVKARCPYADMYHLTEDASKSMRVYSDTNTGYCYMGCGVLTPVSVYAKLNDLSYRSSAYELLEKVGHKFKSFEEKWNLAITPTVDLNLDSYRNALATYCDMWWGSSHDLRYRERVVQAFSQSLEALNKAASETEADQWLEVAKEGMRKLIEKEKQCGNPSQLSEA